MDTSKKYIEMCEKVKEIQKDHIYRTGDWAYDVTYKGVGVFTQYAATLPGHGGVVAFNYIRKLDENCIDGVCWLPRQDQLQEMIIADEGCKGKDKVYWKINWFWEFVQDTCFMSSCDYTEKAFPTMEQLWLAFVMREKYQKEWSTTKKDWVAQQEE